MFSFESAGGAQSGGGAAVASPKANAVKGNEGNGDAGRASGGEGGDCSGDGAGLLSVTLMFDGQMVWSGLSQHQVR